ncbi:MAG TPA: serine/threonine-protein kinase [Polyangiaceae bacterium]|jgi:serine/threonine-protein kinase|nr:serine/threonine-protein kinase [Polyangiaceae bacterium]
MVTNIRPFRVVGRYLLADPIAAGGMATVYLARLMGEEGFSRTVALKQLHPHFSRDADFVDMFLDEARMLSRIRHPNVVSPLDVVMQDGELFIAMEYVHGETLSRLVSPGTSMPPAIASGIMTQVLVGLHAAHEALGEGGQPMDIVHRDVSPQNILVGEDGVAKVVDFGIARALLRNHTTEVGLLKGKLGYMAPEQLRFEAVDRRTDLYGAAIVLWELLTGQRLFATDSPAAARVQVLGGKIPKPSSVVPSLPADLDDFVMQALSANPSGRFLTARAMAGALGQAVHPASVLEVGSWVERAVGPTLAARGEKIVELETVSLSELTLAHPLGVPAGNAPTAMPANAASASAPARSSRHPLEHTGLSMAPSSITKEPGWRRSRAHIWVPTLLGLLCGALVIAAVFLRRPEDHVASGGSEMRAPPSVTALAPAPGTAVAPLKEPAVESASAAPAYPAASTQVVTTAHFASTTARAPATGKSKTASSGKAKSAAPAHHASAASCEPPYSIDSDGIKHFKPECFK